MRYAISFRAGLLPALALAASLLISGCDADSASPASPEAGGGGRGGSLARFAIMGNTLYAVDDTNLRTFDLSTPTTPVPGAVLQVGSGIETIFPHAPYLFIGSQFGMYIYDAAAGGSPQFVGGYQHFMSCDPVVVDGRYAYITLRAGGPCGRGLSQLDVVDLANITQPQLARTFPLAEPYGLGVDSSQVFVCDKGIKVFDARNTPDLRQVGSFDIAATDVIAHRGVLLVTGADGLYQYRYRAAGGGALNLLSRIPVVKK